MTWSVLPTVRTRHKYNAYKNDLNNNAYIIYTMEELDDFFSGNKHLTPNSKRAYKHAYVKIMGGLTKSVKNSTQKEIIEHIENLTNSPNTNNQYLNRRTVPPTRRRHGGV
jgi:hypothetical protein